MQDLSGLYISQSFQNLVQRSASGAFNVLGTATGTEFIPVSASYAISSSHASNADNAISSSYALSASYVSGISAQNLQQVLTAGNTASLGFEVTGDARVNGKLIVSGSSNSIFDIDGFDLEITGGLDVSRDVAVRDDLTVYDDTNLRKDVNVGYRGDSPGFGYSLAVTQSINNSGSAKFVGDVKIENASKLTMSGSIELASSTGSVGQVIGVDAAGNAMWENGTAVDPFPFTGSAQITGSLAVTGSTTFQGLVSQTGLGNSTYFGDGAGISDDLSANTNVGIGYNALTANLGGASNVAIGANSLEFNTSGQSNIAIGKFGLRVNLTGLNNTAVGNTVMFRNTSGNGNTAIGNQALFNNTIGGVNIAVGEDAGVGIIGNSSGNSNPNNSIFIGKETFAAGNNQSNQIVIGHQAVGAGSNTVTLGADTIVTTKLKGDVDIPGELNVLGGITGSLDGSATTAISSSHAISADTAISASHAVNADSSLTAISSSHAINADIAISSSHAVNSDSAISASHALNADNAISSSYALTASFASNVVDAFPFTGSAQITGSLSVTGSTTIRGPLSSGGANGTNTLAAGAAAALGSNSTVNSTDAAIIGGTGHTVTGDTSVIIGGESNTLNSGFSAIVGAASSTITNGDTAIILGGYQNALQGTRTYLLGGNLNVVSNSGAEFSGIIGGQSHTISTAVTASAIIGGKSITATESETIYVPNLDLQDGKKLAMSGSIELASSTGSVGQVIGVDAGGKAKWEDAYAPTPTFTWASGSYTQATTLCDGVFRGVVIPGGTFGVGDIIEVRTMDQITNTSGFTYTNLAIVQQSTNTSGSGYPAGYDAIAQVQTPSNGKAYYQKTLYINATTTAVWTPGNANEGFVESLQGGDPIEKWSIDWSLDQFIFYGACIDNAGATLENFGGVVRKLN